MMDTGGANPAAGDCCKLRPRPRPSAARRSTKVKTHTATAVRRDFCAVRVPTLSGADDAPSVLV